MSAVSLVALASYRYAGRGVCKGEVFSAERGDAFMLKAAGRARDHVQNVLQPIPVPSVEADTSMPQSVVKRLSLRADLSAEASTQRRRTRRTDLAAEE